MRLNGAPSAAPSAARLVLSYGPSQPHGWPASTPGQVAGMTLGGHTAYKDFTYGGMPYRISLLGFVRPGDAPDPIYLDKPVDPDLAFEQTLSAAFGARYGFRYRGGSSSRRELDHYEGRTWRGLQHHLTCVTVAHAFLTCCRLTRGDPDPIRPQTAAA
jgi:hypothetical protein